MNDHIKTLTERRDYLSFRIEAKTKCGWQTEYDEREYNALCYAIETLSQQLVEHNDAQLRLS